MSSQLSDVPFAGRVRQQTISIQHVTIKQNGEAVTTSCERIRAQRDKLFAR